MTVCVDTNVLIQARAVSHPYGVILDAFMLGTMQWAVSTVCCKNIARSQFNSAGLLPGT